MFDEIAKNVMTKRKNFGAPTDMMLKEMVDSKKMAGKTIKIDNIIVRNKLKKNKDTGEVVKSKAGHDVYQAVVYVAFDGDKYFATKSALIIEELKELTGEDIQVREIKDIVVDKLNGETVKLATDKVRYADKHEYDNLIFVDA